MSDLSAPAQKSPKCQLKILTPNVVNLNLLPWRRFRNLLRGRDVQELSELQREGMSIQGISKLTGWDRKTVRKYPLTRLQDRPPPATFVTVAFVDPVLSAEMNASSSSLGEDVEKAGVATLVLVEP